MRATRKIILSFIFMTTLAKLLCAFTIEPVSFELLDNKFRLYIPSDPDVKWVSFHVNINKDFQGFESGQLTGIASMPNNKNWSYEFERRLRDTDIIYVWLAVQYKRLIYRRSSEPISVAAFQRGDPNYKLSTTPLAPASTESPPKPINVDQENKICHSTISEVPRSFGGPYCRGDLIFSDEFDTINTNYWINEIRIPSLIADAEFVVYNGSLGLEKGVLKIEASLNSKDLKKDFINLEARCTSINVENECYIYPQGVLSLPPIISGRLSTRNHFNFKYGRVEVRAKMPIGDWLFPLISLEPVNRMYGDHYKSGEMRIAYIHGNSHLMWQNKNINGGRLFGGVILNKNAESRDQFMKNITIANVKHFGDEFHLYSLKWTSDELIMTVNGNEYGRLKTNFKQETYEPVWSKGESNAPLDQMFFITLGLAAGGNGDFPNTEGKPWSNTDPRGSFKFFTKRSIWYPTWAKPTLEVDYVRVYAV